MVWNIDPGHPGRFANVQMEALLSIPVRRSFLVLLQYLVLSVCVVTVYTVGCQCYRFQGADDCSKTRSVSCLIWMYGKESRTVFDVGVGESPVVCTVGQ